MYGKKSEFETTAVAARVWLFSGFTAEGDKFAHEFSGPESGARSFPFAETCLIGRDRDRCGFFIADPTVSRVHAELRYFAGRGVGIRDMKSANGTFVDGHRIGPDGYQMLDIGALVRIGNVTVTVSYPR
jgi:pSer/pThr/pTyr-binding forkhead associated (FHA) protein